MGNICSLELCNSPLLFFLRYPDLTLHPELLPVFLHFLPMPVPLSPSMGDGLTLLWLLARPLCRKGPAPKLKNRVKEGLQPHPRPLRGLPF